MPSTTYKGYEVQTTGTNSGSWGTVLNEDGLEVIDRNVGGIVAKSLSSSNVTLSAEESENLIVRLTGTLSANVEVETAAQGVQIVENLTSGSFSVTFTDGVAGVVIPQGSRAVVIMDGTNGARIAADTFPSGTPMLFAQTTAPVGWTKDTNYNEHAIRVVSGSASSGGSVNFTTAFASQTTTGTVGNTALTIAQMPAHTHDIDFTRSPANDGGTGTSQRTADFGTTTTTSTGNGQTHTHTLTMDALNLAVKYLDCIMAIKD